MKYVVEDWGIDKFRTVVEQYFGKKIQDFKEIAPFQFQSYLGWHEQVNYSCLGAQFILGILHYGNEHYW